MNVPLQQGRLREITIANIVGVPGVLITVESTVRWLITGFRATLTTSATVASRQLALRIDDGAIVYFSSLLGPIRSASLVSEMLFMQAYLTGTAADTPFFFVPYWEMPLIVPGHRILARGLNFQVDDTLTNIRLFVQEWIEA